MNKPIRTTWWFVEHRDSKMQKLYNPKLINASPVAEWIGWQSYKHFQMNGET
jgi:hypothetical protein